MAAKTVHIEVCDQVIKVCRIARKGRSIRIFESFSFRTPDDCVSDGVIVNPHVLGRELRKQLAEHRLHNAKNVVFALSSSKIAVREIKLPYMKEKYLSKAIYTNAEDYFPVDLKNYHITYTILETVSGPSAFMRLLVLAVPVSMAEGYFQLAEKAGLSVKAIDSSGNSQYQALRSLGLKGGVTIYADINANSSIVSFIRDGNLLLQRTFAFGTEELISHYISVTGKDGDGYLSALRETDVTSPEFAADKVLAPEDIQEGLNRLVSGIVRSVDFFNSNHRENIASRIVLMGSNRHIIGLREMIAEATGLETLFLDDIPEFAAFTGKADDAATYISCIGSTIAPLNLIPPSLQPSHKHAADNKDATVLPGVIACVLLIICASGMAFFSVSRYRSAANNLENIKKEIADLEYTEKIYESYISYQKGEEAVKLVAAESETPNSKLVAFFEELEKKMPSSILILSADCTNDGVSMNITVGSYTDAAAVVSELRGFESLSDIEVGGISRTENNAGVERVALTVYCKYGKNPYLNNINPYGDLINPSGAPSDSQEETQQSGGAGQ